MDLNFTVLVGSVGRHPEVKTLANGNKVANFTMATNRRWKNKAGEREEKVAWHRIQAWGFLAEFAEKYIKKGSRIIVVGEITTHEFIGKDGEKKFSVEIMLSGSSAQLILCDGRTKTAENDNDAPPTMPAQRRASGPAGFADDDIRFAPEVR